MWRPYKLVDTLESITEFVPGRVIFEPFPEATIAVMAIPFWRGPPDSTRARAKQWKGDAHHEGEPAEDGGDDHEGDDDPPEDGPRDDDEECEPGYNSGDDEAAEVGGADLSEVGGGVEIAPAPVPEPPGGDVANRARMAADMVVALPCGGVIRYYSSTKRFVAECKAAGHGKCVREKKVSYRVCSGRPCGLLAAWLEAGEVFDDHTEHLTLGASLPHELREAARRGLAELPVGQELLAAELSDALGILSEPADAS